MSARAVRPANRQIAIDPISTRVFWALRIFGVRNAGTPLETASTPVRAEHPLENARRISRITAAWLRLSACTANSALEATGASPRTVRTRPVTIMTPTEPMNTYVGIAKTVDASRTPRRFTMMSTITNPTASSTRQGFRPGRAEMMLSTPDATDTATVRT